MSCLPAGIMSLVRTMPFQPDPSIVALGIRQPWAELILRGVKTLEIRSLGTQRRGTIYLYAARQLDGTQAALAAARRQNLDLESLPRGLLVGSVEIVDSRASLAKDTDAAYVPAELLDSRFSWLLENPQRFPSPHTVRFLPYGIWFYPYRRRNGAPR